MTSFPERLSYTGVMEFHFELLLAVRVMLLLLVSLFYLRSMSYYTGGHAVSSATFGMP